MKILNIDLKAYLKTNLKANLNTYKFCAIVIAICGLMAAPSHVFSQSGFFSTPDTLLVEDPDSIVEYEFNVVAILPFFSVFIEDDENIPTKRIERMREISVETLNGIRWACDRISSEGYKVNVTILESIPDSLGEFNWGEEELIGADVVLGPLQQQSLSKSIKPIRRVGAEHVLLTRVNDNLLRGNEHMRSATPSPYCFLDHIANRINSQHSQDNIIFFMAGGVEQDMESQFYDLFKLDSLGFNSFGSDSLAFDTIHGSRKSVGSLAETLDFYKRNVVVSLASKSSRSVLSNLQMVVQSNDSTEVYVFAHSAMPQLGFVDIQFLSRTRATVPAQSAVNWSDSTTIAAIRIYRNLYQTDPPDFALRAHDALIDAFRRDLVENLNAAQSTVDSLETEIVWDLSTLPAVIATKFNWIQKYDFGGYVNSAWSLSTYHENIWCPSDSIPALLPFIIPELDEDGKYIKP